MEIYLLKVFLTIFKNFDISLGFFWKLKLLSKLQNNLNFISKFYIIIFINLKN